mgnify:FL=1|tara:strand:+ start:158 stop:280 length:123 start_codon:yes stop_codon:yes gene_type:complete
MDCIGDEKHCKCMDCSYNRAEERYQNMIDNADWNDYGGWD